MSSSFFSILRARRRLPAALLGVVRLDAARAGMARVVGLVSLGVLSMVLAAAPVPMPVPTPVPQPISRFEPQAKGKAAFTLRLDPSRHLKLRLACAVTGRSAQQLVTRALDELLASMPELEAMAERAPAERVSRKG